MENLIRIKENHINRIEEIAGDYPSEEMQIKLNWLYAELEELKNKLNK